MQRLPALKRCRNSLTKPDKMEKRKRPRSKIRWPITILADHATLEGETVNIATDGLFVSCGEPLRLNEIYRLSVLPPNRKPLGVKGKVVWSDLYGIDKDNTAVGVGICLVEISDEDRHYIEEIVVTSLQ